MRTSSLFSLPFALLLAVLELPGILASDSLYSETLLRKDQVQAVLEHQPVTYAACKHIVCTRMCSNRAISLITFDFKADRAYRDYKLRFRDN